MLEGAAGPPKDQEGFTSSPGPILGHVFAEGLVSPSPLSALSTLLILGRSQASDQRVQLCPRSIHNHVGLSPGQYRWYHGTEKSKSETDKQEGDGQADRAGHGDGEQTK